MQTPTTTYDVVIMGAGPAGTTCALALRNSGLKTALIDKASFPRDKVCGDAIPGRVSKVLNSLDRSFAAALRQFPRKCDTKHTTAWYNNRQITFNWTLDAYTCTRYEFDNFLFNLVKDNTDTDVFTSATFTKLSFEEKGIRLQLNNGDTIHTKLLIGADGAQSAVAKQLAGTTIDRSHHIGSVRAYFKDISGMSADTVEIYFEKKMLPGYLWIFPLPGNTANVGFGMLSRQIARKKINLKETLQSFIDASPILRQKFSNASQLGLLEGFSLPLGSRRVTVSGNNFMLAGDAASLVDPITGDGIGNAMLSGSLAAQQAISCFRQNDFSSAFMHNYDTTLRRALGNEFRSHYKMQRILSCAPFLLDVIFNAAENKTIKRMIAKRF